MSLFATPTPDYKNQSASAESRPQGIRDWLSRLLRTPTPAYREVPAPGAYKVHDDGTAE